MAHPTTSRSSQPACLERPLRRRPCRAAGTPTLTALAFTALVLGATGCGGLARAPGCHVVVVVEPGGPVEPAESDWLVDRLGEALAGPGNTVEVIVVSGPNAASATRPRVPGTDADGALETEAASTLARRDAVAELTPRLREFVEEILSGSTDLDDGRDLVGGLGQAARSEPDEVVVFTTSGGVHRTELADWLDPDTDPSIDVELPATTCVELRGIGDIPAPDPGPSLVLTDAVQAAWDEWSADYDDCADR